MFDEVIAFYGGLGSIVIAIILYLLREIRKFHFQLLYNPISNRSTETLKFSWDSPVNSIPNPFNANVFAKKIDFKWHISIPNNAGSVYLYFDYYVSGKRYTRFRLEDVKNAKIQVIQKFYTGTKDQWIPSKYLNNQPHMVDTRNKIHCFDLQSRILCQDIKKEQIGIHITTNNEDGDCNVVISEAYIGKKVKMIHLCGYTLVYFKKSN